MPQEHELDNSTTVNDEEEVVEDEVEDESEETTDESELSDREKQFLARAKRAESKLKERFNQPGEPTKKVVNTEDNLDLRTVLELRGKGYSEDEILEIADMAKDSNIPINNFVQKPFFEPYIKEKRAVQRSTGGTPTPSNRSFQVDKKSFNQLSKKERQSNWGQAIGAVTKKGNQSNE